MRNNVVRVVSLEICFSNDEIQVVHQMVDLSVSP
jgi:hypothetical protein